MSKFDLEKLKGMSDAESIAAIAEHVDTLDPETQGIFKALANNFAGILKSESSDEEDEEDDKDVDADSDEDADRDNDGKEDDGDEAPVAKMGKGAGFSSDPADLHQQWNENGTDVEELEAAPILNDIAVALKSISGRMSYLEEGQAAITKDVRGVKKSLAEQVELVKGINGSVENASATPSGQTASQSATALLKGLKGSEGKEGIINKGVAGTEHTEKVSKSNARYGIDDDVLFKGLFDALNSSDKEALDKGLNVGQLQNLPPIEKRPKWLYEVAARTQGLMLEDE